MERKATSPSADRIIAEIREHRDDSCLLRHEGAQHRARAAKIRRRKPFPTRQTDPDATGFEETNPHVVDDLPQATRVVERELDAIETYLGLLLDEILGQREP
jgi:hypothetical protein